MWTPKRIVLLIVGFGLFLTAYVVYGQYLGGIDGLPALPPGFMDDQATTDPPQPHPYTTNQLDQRLQMAFGTDCPETSSAIKFQVMTKGMVLAAGEFRIEPDGRVRLSPLSVAIFGKPKPDEKFPDINTVRSHVAYLTFDQPITNPADLNKHRIVAGQLVGSVTITNNRRTPEIDDDLTVFTHGPMDYDDETHRVWTTAPLQMQDLQSKPNPTKVTAVGMDLLLIPEDESAKAPASKKDRDKADALPKQPAFAGVERVILKQDVRMELYTDSGLLGPTRDSKVTAKDGTVVAVDPAKPPAAPKDRSRVIITTQGPFNYDAQNHLAVFSISDHPGPFPNRVVVNRSSSLNPSASDELDCERLELQFRPREGENQPGEVVSTTGEKGHNLEIETAHATGQDVLMKSDAEMLEAYGNDFFYDARTRTTTFKGEPEMSAVKEGNELHCRQLVLIDAKDKGQQQATAIGPGRISMLDKQTGKRSRHAAWQEKLVFHKEGTTDLLVLTRGASFRDDDQDQLLQADSIKVWMQPDAQAKPDDAAKGQDSGNRVAVIDSSRKPQKLEAKGNVQAKAPQLRVCQKPNDPPCERLLILFKDVSPDDPSLPKPDPKLAGQAKEPAVPNQKLPEVAPKSAEPAAESPAKPLPAVAEAPRQPKPQGARESKPAGPATAAKDQPRAQPPLELTARTIEAHVLRAGTRNELHRLFTDGHVIVRQEGATPQDRGIDIHGEKLQLMRKPEGNVLVVTDEQNLAQMRMNKLYIVGPVVHIDQAENKAWVTGDGFMEMESNVDFQGGKLKKTVPMQVFWKKDMYFDGQQAFFQGGVQAEQDNAVLLCQTMQVFLDKVVSMKEGENTGGEGAKVRTLSCDQSVRIEDKTFEGGKLVKYQRLECPEVSVDNEEGLVRASGPGVVRILQPDAAQVDPAKPAVPGKPTVVTTSHQGQRQDGAKKDEKKKADDELKLTKINYTGRMAANNKTHTAVFTDGVEVVNVPSDDPNFEPNLDKLPAGGFYLKCDRLDVYSRQVDGKSTNELLAKGHIKFRAQDYYGLAVKVTYHEVKDQVILEGSPAQLSRIRAQGTAGDVIQAEKIIYLRKTGEFQIINGGSVTGQQGP